MPLVLHRSSAPHPPTPPAAPWQNSGIHVPSNIPGMLTRDERKYLAWVGAQSPTGRIAELGCFLGCSTTALLAGLAERDRRRGEVDPQARVITYDSFVMPHGGGRHWAPGVQEGEWFADIFEANVAPYACAGGQRRLSVRHGWIAEYASLESSRELYAEQEPIDALFIDIAKVWGVHNTLLNAFLSFLPVGAVVMQQDFKSWLPWLFLHMWQLRGQFEPAHDVPGGTVGFVRRSATEPEALWTASSFPSGRFDEVWNGVESSWRGFGTGQTAIHALLARGRHAISIGRHDHGVECFELAAADRLSLCARADFEPCRPVFESTWTDALVAMNRGLVKARAAAPVVERAARVA